jgi:protein-tyrosine phosphatase
MMMTSANDHSVGGAAENSRVIRLERGFNIRDVGGLHTSDGQRVRRDKVFRSEDLLYASTADVQALGRLGIRTVVDLRTTQECGERESPMWDGLGATVHACPLVVQVPPHAEHGRYLEPRWTSGLYLKMLSDNPEGHAPLWRALAEGSSRGVSLIHCLSGRDRTGIVVALLLELLGVREVGIVADYAMSATGMERMMDWIELNIAGGVDAVTTDRTAMVTTDPETMRMFLAQFRQRYGSADGYAKELAITPYVTELRRNLLEPA